jgi:hypothetical protein
MMTKQIKYIFIFYLLSISVYSQVLNKEFVSTAAKKISILPLGNSITYDDRANDTRSTGERAGYRKLLYNLLKDAGYNFDFIGSEHSGGNYLPAGYDENGGFPGIKDNELATLLKTGKLNMPEFNIERQITPKCYFDIYTPDVILLHIGTNGNQKPDGTDPSDVEDILDEVKRYEDSTGHPITVIMAKIIDRVPNQNYVTQFNSNIENMALARMNNQNNDAYPDNIFIVDMQKGAGINYVISPDPNGTPGDMNDMLHPNDNGYAKMAQTWFEALKQVLPAPPVINMQPENYYAVEGGIAKFHVSVSSNDPVTFLWKKNNVALSLSNDSTLRLTEINLNDNNADIQCVVTNNNGTAISSSVKLFVNQSNIRTSHNLIASYEFGNTVGDSIINNIDHQNNLIISDPANVSLFDNGIQINDATNILTANPVSNIVDSINVANEFSIELWINNSGANEIERSRIITISENNDYRNFSIDRVDKKISFRVRTTETDLNGLPETFSKNEIGTDELTHLIVTRNKNNEEAIFINGKIDTTINLNGNLSNWNNDFKLLVGNEFFTNRSWLGKIYYLAIYNRSLNENEVKHNYTFDDYDLTSIETELTLKNDFELFQNYPNPFNPVTNISFSLDRNSNVQFSVYNCLGEEVLVEEQNYTAGYHKLIFDGSNLSSGTYIYSIKSIGIEGKTQFKTRKMLLLK